MAVKLRLMRMGKKKQPTYRVVAADSRSPRNGRFIEIIGTYDPRQEPSIVEIDTEKAADWIRRVRSRPRRSLASSRSPKRSRPPRPLSSPRPPPTLGTSPPHERRVGHDRADVDDEGDDEPTDVDDDAGDADVDPNSVPAATATSVLDLLVTSLVDDPDAVRIDPIQQRDRVRLEVRVGPDDMGRVIGKRGRVANAIRTVVRAAAVRDGVDVDIEFED